MDLRFLIIVPVTLLLMSFILYSAFGSWKWVGLILAVVALSPLGGFLSLLITGTHFSVSSGLGFLALIGVSVEVGVIKDKDAHSYRVNGTAQPLWFMFSGGFESYLRSYSFNGLAILPSRGGSGGLAQVDRKLVLPSSQSAQTALAAPEFCIVDTPSRGHLAA